MPSRRARSYLAYLRPPSCPVCQVAPAPPADACTDAYGQYTSHTRIRICGQKAHVRTHTHTHTRRDLTGLKSCGLDLTGPDSTRLDPAGLDSDFGFDFDWFLTGLK